MKHQDERNEAELAELFAATRQDADGPQLTKLLARAEGIPGARRGWVSRWLWAPALAGMGAAAALVWTGAESPDSGAAHTVVAHTTAAEQIRLAPAPLPTIDDEGTLAALETLDEIDQELESSLGGNALVSTVSAEVSDDEGWDLLHGPPPDADLDAWLAATEELLAEGG